MGAHCRALQQSPEELLLTIIVPGGGLIGSWRRRTTRVRLWNENCGPLGARGIILLLCPVRRNRIIEVVRWWLPGVRVAWHHKNIIYSPHHIIGHHQMDNWRLCVFVASSATTIIMGPQSLHPLIWAANN